MIWVRGLDRCILAPDPHLAELNEERLRVGLGYRKGVVRTELERKERMYERMHQCSLKQSYSSSGCTILDTLLLYYQQTPGLGATCSYHQGC